MHFHGNVISATCKLALLLCSSRCMVHCCLVLSCLNFASSSVQVKSYQLESDWITSKMAMTYDKWRRSGVITMPMPVSTGRTRHWAPSALVTWFRGFCLWPDVIQSDPRMLFLQGNDSESYHQSFDKARFSYFLSKGITISMRGKERFDIDYYITSNLDMPPETCTWDHCITKGQFEGRPFRFTSSCQSFALFLGSPVSSA